MSFNNRNQTLFNLSLTMHVNTSRFNLGNQFYYDNFQLFLIQSFIQHLTLHRQHYNALRFFAFAKFTSLKTLTTTFACNTAALLLTKEHRLTTLSIGTRQESLRGKDRLGSCSWPLDICAKGDTRIHAVFRGWALETHSPIPH